MTNNEQHLINQNQQKILVHQFKKVLEQRDEFVMIEDILPFLAGKALDEDPHDVELITLWTLIRSLPEYRSRWLDCND